MFGLQRRVYVYSGPVDMRKSYDGLYGLIRDSCDPLNGDVFLFMSKNRKRAKALFFDGTGLNIWMKRLERGRFADIFNRCEISMSELQIFLEGSKKVKERISPKNLSKEFQK